MAQLPPTVAVPVIRTYFGDDALWARLQEEITSATEEGFLANVDFVDDRGFEGLDEVALKAAVPGDYPDSYDHPVLFVVDAVTATSQESPILVVDLDAEAYPSFRTTPRQVQSIENNLSIANMDFEEFADAADEDGIFRG